MDASITTGSMGLFLGLLLAWGPAGSSPAQTSSGNDEHPRTEQRSACKRRCQSIASPTDRQTCRLQCKEQQRAKASPNVVEYEVVRPTDTVEVRSVDGRPVEPGSRASKRARQTVRAMPRRAFLARCQAGCNDTPSPGNRATCKLQCLSHPQAEPGATRQSTVPRRPATRQPVDAEPSGPPPGPPSRQTDPQAAARCAQACDEHEDLSPTDRATCRQNCRRDLRSHRWRDRVQKRSGAASSPAPKGDRGAAAAACRGACRCKTRCERRQRGCDRGCTDMKGSDRTTCRLQCEQRQRTCQRQCGLDGCRC